MDTKSYSNKVCRGLFCYVYYRLYPFVDAYTGPFTERHHYWTGLLLLIRIFIAIIFTYMESPANES